MYGEVLLSPYPAYQFRVSWVSNEVPRPVAECGPTEPENCRGEQGMFHDIEENGSPRPGKQATTVRFSSPMAERFYFKRLVPRFAHFDPKSVRELITKVLGSLSSALRASVDGSHGFPDEITFRQQLMKGIALNTTYTCSTCPELPRVFPVAATDNRGVVFFVNASQKWGLEFFVNGGNAQDYTSQFAPGGRYAALEVDDYVVVDLRGNATGTVSDDVALKEKLVSVFFKLGDFSRCQCAFGMDETQHDIDLS